jgi:3',5'-cyclic AMP phosphodiesterase CpdA
MFLPILVVLLTAASAFAEVQTYAVIGDAGHWNKNAQAVRDSILKSQVSHLILPGDNLYDITKSYDWVWSNWSSAGLQFDVVALGNHFKSYAEEMAYFQMPSENYEKIFDNVRFLVLNSNNVKTAEAQVLWLKEKLAEPAPLFTLLVFHHPPATISRYHSWQEKEKFQTLLRPLLLKHADIIDAAIVGHDHQAQLFTFGPLPVIVSGAVWEGRNTVPTNTTMEGKIAIQTHWINKEGYYWVRLDLNDQDQTLWVNFVRGDKDEVSCSILLKKGKAPQRRANCLTKPQ